MSNIPYCLSCNERPSARALFELRGNRRCTSCYLKEAKIRRILRYDNYDLRCKNHPDRNVSKSFYIGKGRLLCSSCSYRSSGGTIKQYTEKRAMVRDYKSTHPCVDCGESDVRCLDFDHIGEKKFAVSTGMGYRMETIMEEISKCVVRCANCHRKKHVKF